MIINKLNIQEAQQVDHQQHRTGHKEFKHSGYNNGYFSTF